MGRINTIQGFAGVTSIVNQSLEPEYFGSTMVFAQAYAPSGWTKNTTYNDYSLRVTSGTGGVATTSNQPFSTVFSTNRNVFPPESGSWALGATDVTTVSTAMLAPHTHSSYPPAASGFSGYTPGWPGSGPGQTFSGYGSPLTAHPNTVGGSTGTGGGHSHASGTVTSISYSSPFNFNILYKDVILAKYH